MEKIYLVLLLFVLSSCSTHVMTPQKFETIQPGMPMEEVEKQCGEPYQVKTMSSGFKEHTYIQRIPVSSESDEHEVYVIYSCKGRVVSKNIRLDPKGIDVNYRQ